MYSAPSLPLPLIIAPPTPTTTFLSPPDDPTIKIPLRPATPATHLLPQSPQSTGLSDLEDKEGQKELTHLPKLRKFGKNLARRQLDFPDYAPSFVNYKALKKVCALRERGSRGI